MYSTLSITLSNLSTPGDSTWHRYVYDYSYTGCDLKKPKETSNIKGLSNNQWTTNQDSNNESTLLRLAPPSTYHRGAIDLGRFDMTPCIFMLRSDFTGRFPEPVHQICLVRVSFVLIDFERQPSTWPCILIPIFILTLIIIQWRSKLQCFSTFSSILLYEFQTQSIATLPLALASNHQISFADVFLNTFVSYLPSQEHWSLLWETQQSDLWGSGKAQRRCEAKIIANMVKDAHCISLHLTPNMCLNLKELSHIEPKTSALALRSDQPISLANILLPLCLQTLEAS